MAYNTQIVVDDKFKFIVATEVSSDANDNNKLHRMATQTKEIIQNEDMVIIGDSGYYSSKELEKCEKDNIEVVVAVPNKEKQQKDRGFYLHSDFTYDKKEDCYICPNKQTLTKSNSVITKNNGTKSFVYRAGSKICKPCPLRDDCIPKKTPYKRVMRLEHSDIVLKHKEKMQTDRAKKLIRQRGSIVEHPFGTIKQHLGWSHFLVRGKEKVSGENALIMFTYNFRRLLNLIGITLFRKLLISLKDGNIEAIKAEILAYIAYFMLYCIYFLQFLKFIYFRDGKYYYSLN